MVNAEQLASAIRSIGGSGVPFSSAELRAHLGMTTEDRRTLTRFNAAVRSYCRDNEDMLERIGKNRYRLLEPLPELAERRPLRHVVIRITRTSAEAEPEPDVFWLWTLLSKLGLWWRRTIALGASSGPS